MHKVIKIVMLSAVLGGCAITQSPEEAFSPSAMVGAQAQRCERDARTASASTSATFPRPGTTPRGDADTARDVNRQVYYHCATELPVTR